MAARQRLVVNAENPFSPKRRDCAFASWMMTAIRLTRRHWCSTVSVLLRFQLATLSMHLKSLEIWLPRRSFLT